MWLKRWIVWKAYNKKQWPLCPPLLPQAHFPETTPLHLFKKVLFGNYLHIFKYRCTICTSVWGLLNKVPQAGGIKEWECVLPQFWNLEVPSQGVSRAMLPLKALGKNPSVPLPASAGGCPSLVLLGLWLHHSHLCCHVAFFCCHMVLPSSYEDTSHGLEPTTMTSS